MRDEKLNLEYFLDSIPPIVWNKISSIDFNAGSFNSNLIHLNSEELRKRNIKKHIQVSKEFFDKNIHDFENRINSKKIKDSVKKFEKNYRNTIQDFYLKPEKVKIKDDLIKSNLNIFRGNRNVKKTNNFLTDFKNKREQKINNYKEDHLGEIASCIFSKIKSGNLHPIPAISFINTLLTHNNTNNYSIFTNPLLIDLLLIKSKYNFISYKSFLHEDSLERFKIKSHLPNGKDQKIDFQLESLLVFIQNLEKNLEEVNNLFEHEKEIINLSKYQKEVYYLFEEYNKCTPRLIEREIKIARPTVNQILRKLEKIGLIKRIGKGRSTEYALNK